MSIPLALLLTVIPLTGNAFFAGVEFAVTPSRCSQLESLAEAGDTCVITALRALQNVSRTLATAQLGVTLCSIGLGIVTEPVIAHALELLLAAVGVGYAGSHAVVAVIVLVIVVGLHVVTGEMVPKNISIASPGEVVRWLAPPLVWYSRVFGPVVNALNGFANGVLKILGTGTKEEIVAAFNAEEVASIVECSIAEGVLKDFTGLFSGALEFSEETVGNVMVPLSELITLAQDCTPENVGRAVASTGFSHFPLVANQAAVDQGEEPVITGYLHLKDTFYADGAECTEPVPAWRARALVSIGYDDEVEEVLAAMQRSKAYLGHVCNVQGRFVRVLFLEDILEELVGEVNDAMQRKEHQRRD